MKRSGIFLAVLFFTLIAGHTLTYAQLGGHVKPVQLLTYQSFDKVYPGSEFKVAVKVMVDSGWHINSDKPHEDFLIPSQFSVDTSVFKLVKVAYPQAQDFKTRDFRNAAFSMGKRSICCCPG